MKFWISMLFLLSVLLLAPGAAETIAGLPVHVEELAPGAIRVWLGDHISSTNSVAVATDAGILVIDTLGFPEIDRELRGVIAHELGRDDFAMLINTHEHGDHTGGNVVYRDCPIVGHELVEAGMQPDEEMRPRFIAWSTERIAELEQQLADLADGDPEAGRLREELILERLSLAHSQEPPPVVPPTRTFGDRLALDLGGTRVELSYIGGLHSASDIAVFLPDHGLLLTGDTMADTWLTETPGCLANFGARSGVRHDFPRWLASWHDLLARRAEIERLLPGHWNGELSLAGAEARVRYVEDLWTFAIRAAEAGEPLDAMLGSCGLADRYSHLVDSPGFTSRSHFLTMVEIWTEATGQTSAARTLYSLLEEGADEAEVRALVAECGAERPTHFFLEPDINGWGYRFLQTGRPAEAEVMFRINLELFPDSWNCYDSLGEALAALDRHDEAIAMYEKSLALNPENANGEDWLERLRSP